MEDSNHLTGIGENGIPVTAKHPFYNGFLESSSLSGDVQLTIGEDGLLMSTLFEQCAVVYADIVSVAMEDCVVQLQAADDLYVLSRMGEQSEWFYRDLLEAYDSRVLKAFFVRGRPEFETKGRYAAQDTEGEAKIQIFSDCLCVLPPDKNARRLPFAFMNGMQKENYSFSLSLNTGERYTFSMLGYDLEPLIRQTERHILRLREADTSFAEKLCGTLGFTEKAQVQGMVHEGNAVPLARISGAFPALAAAMEAKAKNSKMGKTYSMLRELCDGNRLCLGIREVPEERRELLKENLLEQLSKNGEAELTSEQEDALRWIVWAAAPSRDGSTVIVEFSFPDEDAATYLFRIRQDWDSFLPLLNRAMEAVQLRREVISLSEEELAFRHDIRIMIERTPAIKKLRGLFLGRVIHRSAESWKKRVMTCIERAAEGGDVPQKRFCTDCGAELFAGARFCGQCGKPMS